MSSEKGNSSFIQNTDCWGTRSPQFSSIHLACTRLRFSSPQCKIHYGQVGPLHDQKRNSWICPTVVSHKWQIRTKFGLRTLGRWVRLVSFLKRHKNNCIVQAAVLCSMHFLLLNIQCHMCVGYMHSCKGVCLQWLVGKNVWLLTVIQKQFSCLACGCLWSLVPSIPLCWWLQLARPSNTTVFFY